MAKANKKTAKKAAKKPTQKKTAVKTKTVAKKAAKKAAKKTAKKVAAKKTVAKKTAKKVAAKKTAKKVVAKKTAKKVVAKKVAAKKTAKKVEAKKQATKKNVKQTTPNKTAAKVAKKAEAPQKVSVKTEQKVEAKKKQSLTATSDKPSGVVSKKIYIDEDEPEVQVAPKASKAKNKEIVELEHKINDEVVALGESFSWEEVAEAIGTLDFFVDHRSDECLEKGCDNLRTTQQYCRLHYFANWYDIKKKREILKSGRLQEYIEELISKYPPTLMEAIVQDLADEKDFYRALNELNISSDFEVDDEAFEGADDDDDDTDDIAVETRNFANHRFEDEQ